MNYLSPLLQPIVDVWDHFTLDNDFLEATKYPGGYVDKWIANQRLRVNREYTSAWNSFYGEPTVTGTLGENFMRFSVLAFAERWVAIRQAHGFLKTRFLLANTNAGALNGVRAQGLSGSFRGNLWHILQFVGVQYHALALSNNDPFKFIALSTAFEFLLFPLDTVKTLNYADVKKSFRNTFDLVAKTAERGGLTQFYSGAFFKAGYNAFFGLNLWAMANGSNLQWFTFPAWVASYALLTIKTRLQVANSSLSFSNEGQGDKVLKHIIGKEGIRGLYAGLVPFLAVNLLFAWSFPSLLSDDVKRSKLNEIVSKAPKEYANRKYA